MEIYSVNYTFQNKEIIGNEICSTSYTKRSKALAYMRSKIDAVKHDFISNVCHCNENDDISHIQEIYGMNVYSIKNTKTDEFARLTIEETDLVTD